MTPSVIAAGLNRRGPVARPLPNNRYRAPECILRWARMRRVTQPKPPNRDEWPRFRSMLDFATVFGGWEESSGKSRLIWGSDLGKADQIDANRAPQSLCGVEEREVDDAPQYVRENFSCFGENLNQALRSEFGEVIYDEKIV